MRRHSKLFLGAVSGRLSSINGSLPFACDCSIGNSIRGATAHLPKPLDKRTLAGLIIVMASPFVLRKEMVEIGRRMYDKGFVAGTDGNISCRLPDNQILITPSGLAKGRLGPQDMVIIDFAGNVVTGALKPSSEFMLHTFIYSQRDDIDAIVHAHPVYCTAYASAGKPLAPCILPEVILNMGDIPLAQYGTPSTPEVARSVEDLIKCHDTILLENHGVVAGGKDLDDAYNKLELVEHFAKIVHAAESIGGAKPLSREAADKLMKIKEKINPDAPDHSCISCMSCKEE